MRMIKFLVAQCDDRCNYFNFTQPKEPAVCSHPKFVDEGKLPVILLKKGSAFPTFCPLEVEV